MTLALPISAILQIEDLYEQGLMLQAYKLVREVGPLQNLSGTRERIIVGRLVTNLGTERLGHYLFRRAYRDDPGDPAARYYAARTVLDRRGPYFTLEFLRGLGPAPWQTAGREETWPSFESNMVGLEACQYAMLRDFSRADKLIARALELDPGCPWLYVELAHIREWEDRCGEAIAAVRRALELQPFYRPAVQALGHLLTLQGEDEEALAFLTEANGKLENMYVLYQLICLQQELGLHAEARAQLQQFMALAPLASRRFRNWHNIALANAHYYCGDFGAAAAYAEKVPKQEFFKTFAQRLRERSPGGHRVRLPVGFTRQHYKTCVPACLASLCRFWGKPVEHLEIAQAICYDGTPSHTERRWAMEHGFVAQEFKVTWEAAVQLLNRGIPFIFNTADATRGHAQIVMGYDLIRNTLLIRDPFLRSMQEFDALKTFEQFQASGPRGLVLLPEDQRHLREDLATDFPGGLPEAALYDQLFELQSALDKHRRPAAEAASQQLATLAPEHRITYYAQRCLAFYDGNMPAALAATDALLRQFPEDSALQLTRYQCLRELAPRNERLAYLEQQSAKPAAHPVFQQRLAHELLEDSRQQERVKGLLRGLLRRVPFEAEAYVLMGHTFWIQRAWNSAMEHYRIAACLEDKEERYARSYFSASGAIRGSEEALDFLRERFALHGKASSLPARTLFGALESIDRTEEAFAVLHKALQLKPEDSELLLFAAGAQVRYGHEEEYRTLLARAESLAHPIDWLYTAAQGATIRCEHATALAYWRRVLEASPLTLDAHRNLAELLTLTDSRAAAGQHLRAAAEAFPHHVALQQYYAEWLRGEDPKQAEPVLRQILQGDPLNAWAQRELALNLSHQNRHEEAELAGETALPMAPHLSTSYSTLALVYKQAGKLSAARAAAQLALERSIDDQWAMSMLMELCDTTVARREALTLVQEQLVKQVIYGDGLLEFRRQAMATLTPEEVETQLRAALAVRPDLWQAHSALTSQLLSMNKFDEALTLATQATARFGLVPKMWCDLAEVYAARHEVAAQREALRRALAINPNWSVPARLLAVTYEDEGQIPEATEIVRKACAREPLEGQNHGYLAHLLQKSGFMEAALQAVEHALKLNPHNANSWYVLGDLATQLAQPDLPARQARQLTQSRPGDAAIWILLARHLPSSQLDEAQFAVLKALALEPRNVEAHDLYAAILAEKRQFEEAFKACQPEIFALQPSRVLQARAAWIRAQSGALEQAIDEMKAVLEVDQSNLWGWRLLADWYRQQKLFERYREAALKMTSLWPQNARNHDYLADALLCVNEEFAARQELQISLNLEPSGRYALDTLMDLQLRNHECDNIKNTLEQFRRYYPPEVVAQQELRVAVKNADHDTALQALGRLGKAAVPSGPIMREACQQLGQFPPLRRQATELLETLLARVPKSAAKPINAVFGLIQLHIGAKKFKQAEALIPLLPVDSPVFAASVNDYLEALAVHNLGSSYAAFVKKYTGVLQSEINLWAAVGWGFARLERHQDVIKWLGNYEGRSGLNSAPLLNLSNAYRRFGRLAEAHRASVAALALPRDENTVLHELWLLLDELLDAQAGKLNARTNPGIKQIAARWAPVLKASKPDNHPAFYQYLYYLAQMTLDATDPKGLSLVRLRDHFHQLQRVVPVLSKNPTLARYLRRTFKKIYRDQDGLLVRLYAGYRYLIH